VDVERERLLVSEEEVPSLEQLVVPREDVVMEVVHDASCGHVWWLADQTPLHQLPDGHVYPIELPLHCELEVVLRLLPLGQTVLERV